MNLALLAVIIGIIALVFAGITVIGILNKSRGNEKMQEIAKSIQEGAMAFMKRQYKTIAIFAMLLFIVIAFAIPKGEHSNGLLMAIGFIIGALFSALAGYIGMNVSIRTNVRTTQAAKEGLAEALKLAFKGGSVTGMSVVGLSLIGVGAFYYIFTQFLDIPTSETPSLLIGFGFGASLVSLFARVGGGIFTKAADVGADLVGKVEKGIPEDDPRNPAVIADNVGDNVGDCAGMGADLFETYAVTLIAAMILAATTELGVKAVEFPLLVGAIAIIASIIGSFFLKLGKNNNIMGALYKPLIATGILAGIGFFFAVKYTFNDLNLFWACLVGLGLTLFINLITEYYTATRYNPVKKIAKASETGAGTNVIAGLAVGLQSTVVPVIIICIGIYLAYKFGAASSLESGIYGIATAAVAMLSVTGIIISLDSYGPITDNAGGIAEMAELSEDIRKNTDALDAVGNTTKAVTKGYAIGSAALAALVLFQAYGEELIKGGLTANEIVFELVDAKVIIGLFLGGMLPFLFSAFCMESVGKAGYKIVEEVRRQFKEIPGIMERKAKPDYGKCVDIVTLAALKEMVAPGLLAVLAPVIIGVVLGYQALAGLLAGVIISGLLMALFMSNGGGAWDNAKKLIESGKHGGKGSEAHKAAVVGDTVGDPFKDTAGPALNALIKVINTIALIIAPIIAGSSLL